MTTAPAQKTPEGTGGGLSRQAAGGVLWTMSQKWVIRITSLVTVAILTRLLTPEHFGIVAVALALLPLIQVLSDLGFSTYLVQAEDPGRRTFSTAFWFSTTAGLFLCAGLVASAPVIGTLLDEPGVVPVIQGMAPAAFLVSAGAVPTAMLRRAMRFKALAIQAVVAGAAGQVIAIVLAVCGFGVWALVAQTVLFQLVATALAWIAVRWVPAPAFSWSDFRVMVRFGIKVVGIEFVTLSRAWAETAIVLALLGATGLGYLSIAQRLIQIASDLTTTALVPVSVVVFAQIRSAAERLRSAYMRALSMSYALVVPIMLMIAVGAPWLIPLLFGHQWEAAIGPAQILALAGVFSLSALDHGLFFGLGKPGTWFYYAVVIEIVTLSVTALAAPHGLMAVAMGFLAVSIAATATRSVLVGVHLGTRWWRVALPLLRAIVPAAVAGGAGLAISWMTGGLPGIVVLLLIGLGIAVVYVFLLRIMMRNTWDEMMDLASAGLRKIRRPRAQAR